MPSTADPFHNHLFKIRILYKLMLQLCKKIRIGSDNNFTNITAAECKGHVIPYMAFDGDICNTHARVYTWFMLIISINILNTHDPNAIAEITIGKLSLLQQLEFTPNISPTHVRYIPVPKG